MRLELIGTRHFVLHFSAQTGADFCVTARACLPEELQDLNGYVAAVEVGQQLR